MKKVNYRMKLASSKKDFFWNTLGISFWSFLSLFLIMIVSRINGRNALGDFSYAFGMGTIFWSIGFYGGRLYQVSDVKRQFLDGDYFYSRVFTSVIMFTSGIVFCFVSKFDYQQTAWMILILLYRVSDVLADPIYGLFQKNYQLYIAGISMFFKAFLGVFFFFLIDCFTKNVTLALFTLVSINFLMIVFFDLYKIRKSKHIPTEVWKIKPSIFPIIMILFTNISVFFQQLLVQITANISRYFIESYHKDLQGYFGILIMPISFLSLLGIAIFQPLIVSLSYSVNEANSKGIQKIVKRFLFLFLFLGLVFFLITYILGIPLLNLIFKIKLDAYKIDLLIIILIGIINTMCVMYMNILTIGRKLKYILFNTIFSLLLLIIISLFFVSRYGIRGAVLAYLLAMISQLIVYYFGYKFFLKTLIKRKKL